MTSEFSSQSSDTTLHRARVARSTRRLNNEAEAILRDVAYVLRLTQRVKAQILDKQPLAQTATL